MDKQDGCSILKNDVNKNVCFFIDEYGGIYINPRDIEAITENVELPMRVSATIKQVQIFPE